MPQSPAQQKYKADSPSFWKEDASSFLEELLSQKMISPIEVYFAKKMDEHFSIQTSLLLWIYLYKASLEGHVCVQIKPKYLPHVVDLFRKEQHEVEKSFLEKIVHRLNEDYALIESCALKDSPWITLKEHCLYLTQNYHKEEAFWQVVHQLEKKTVEREIKILDLNPALTEEQQKAIQLSISVCFSLITGGPGVGKTFTAIELVEAFLKAWPEAKVALVAPTGKAAANLGGAFSHFDASSVEVFTLHKLLLTPIYSFLPFDLLLMDESSMVDLFRMTRLIQVLKPGSRCVFLGDPHQLPPIETGAMFADLVKVYPLVSHLSLCLRAEKKELIEAASYVKEKEVSSFISLLEKKQSLHALESQKQVQLKLQQQMETFWNYNSLKEFLLSLQNFMILSPIKKGMWGIHALNDYFKNKFQDKRMHPVMITQNHAELELFNGDIGVLFENQWAYFPLRHEGQSYQESSFRKIPKAHLPSFDFAYCLSIHKSQGSEYHHVSLLFPVGSEVFGRKLLYTALTRAKKSFEIYSDLPTLQKLITSSTQRYSRVQLTHDE